MNTLNGVVKTLTCLVIFCIGQVLCAEDVKPRYSMQKSERKLIEHLEHTVYLLCGPDGGAVGVAMRLRNLSEKNAITLDRQEDGNIPFNIHVRDKARKLINQRFGTSLNGGQFSDGDLRHVRWVLKPGESRWFFVALRNLFDPLPTWERLEGCRIDEITIRIHPPAELMIAARKRYSELLAAERKRELPSDRVEIEERTPAIDMPFACELFQNITLTQASLHADAGKAYEEAKREIEKQMPNK